MVNYKEAVQRLGELLEKEAEEWSAGPLFIKIAKSLTNDDEIDFDFSITIGHDKRRPKTPSDENCYWLPVNINENSATFREKNIYGIFSVACYHAGFNLVANWMKREECVVFGCNRKRFHNEERNKDQMSKRPRNVKDQSKEPAQRDRKTVRPIKENDEETCKFSFRVYWDSDKERWFLPKQQSGSLKHCGHGHFDSKLLRLEAKHGLSADEQKLASDCFQTKNTTTGTTNLLNYRKNIGLERHQIQYLKKKSKNDLVINDMDPDNVPNTAEITAADRTLAILKNKPNVSFTALTAECSSGLITLKRRKQSFNNSVTVEEFNMELQDNTDSPEDFAARELGVDAPFSTSTSTGGKKSENERKVPKNLHLKNGQVLLALAWTTDGGRREFDMFPEIVFGDATEETNSEERPLYTLLGKDNMNKSFGHTWCFMPSNAKWAYSWFFEDAVPILHPGTACKRVKLILTDACHQETSAIANCIGKGKEDFKVYPNAFHRHCGWHKVNRNFTNHSDYKSRLATVRNSSVNNSVEVSLITRWLWYFIKHYETEEEVNLAMKLIKQYLNEDQSSHKGEIDEDTRAAIRGFFTKSFECNKGMLCEGYFNGVMTLGNCTTGVSEAEHRAYKNSATCLGPGDDLAESTDKLIIRAETKDAVKGRSMTHQIRSHSGKADDRYKKADELSDYANKMMLEQYNSAGELVAYRASDDLFYIKKDYRHDKVYSPEEIEAAESECDDLFANASNQKKGVQFGSGKEAVEDFKRLLCAEIRRVVPRFERTTVVRVVDVPDSNANEKMLVCSRCFQKTSYACRHIYKLVKRYPVLTDANIRWHKSYPQYYGVNQDMTKCLQDLRDKCDLPGVPITDEEFGAINEAYPVGHGGAPKDFFTRSLGKLRLRGTRENNHWKASSSYYSAFLGVDRSYFACSDTEDDSIGIDNEGSSVASSDVVAKSLNTTGVGPCGASGVIHGKSLYQVPSEMARNEDDDVVRAVGLKVDAYQNFLPFYSESMKLVDGLDVGGAGEGTAVARKYFNQMLGELKQLMHKKRGSADAKGMRSGPKVSDKRKPKRKKMATSPPGKVSKKST
jgi:hypothetical protein